MKSWNYEIGDVLLIHRKEQEALARIAGYVDSLDNTKPLYVNLRVSGGLRWSVSQYKIAPGHIIKYLPNWQEEQTAKTDNLF